MTRLVTLLQRLGFGEYEAKAYVALLKRNPLNGYELAKASGLPRPNVYAVLQKLEERGAVVRLETPEGARYAPVSPTELTQRVGSRFQETLHDARDLLEKIATPAEHEYVWNARGYSALQEHAAACVEATQKRLLVAVWPEEAQALADNMARAEARGVEITTLCLAACAAECGGCRGRIHRYCVAPEKRARWLVLVSDEVELLAGGIDRDEEALTVSTRQRVLVELAAWYIRHSIALAALLNDLGDRLEHLINAKTKSVLASVGPGGRHGGWLEYMRQILNQPGERTTKQERTNRQRS
jgi:DNA-binding MarR family transcriptional regulator